MRAGSRTTTQDDIHDGRVIFDFGMAPARPAEFGILGVAQKASEQAGTNRPGARVASSTRLRQELIVSPVQRPDPYPGYNFQVVLNGVSDDGAAVSGSFSEVSGLGVEITPIEYRNGSEDITVRKLPGLKKFPNIVLKRGITGDVGFWNWIAEAMDGQVRRADGSIVLLDENRQEVMRFNFRRAWPTKWEGPSLSATSNDVAIETLEICHEGLEIER